MEFKYFTNQDFKRANPSCAIDQMDLEFLMKLDEAREKASVPFIINSAYRSVQHEKAQGRKGTSSHVKGCAVDIATIGSRDRFLILAALIEVGFNRIGIGKTFIHVDNDADKSDNVLWDYYGK